MKQKKLIPLLVAEAVVLGGLALVTQLLPSVLSSVLAFPMEPVALGIKALAAAGPVGNGVAVMLFAACVLLPIIFALRIKSTPLSLVKDSRVPERAALIGLSCMILVGLYGSLNPGAFVKNIPEGAEESFSRVMRTFFSLSAITMLLLFIVLRLIRLFRIGSREQLLRYLRNFLCVLCMYFTGCLAVALVTGVVTLVKGMPTQADAVLCTLKTAATLLTLLLDILVSLHMLALLESAATEEQEGLADAASRLIRTSCTALACTAGASALVHAVQILLLPSLTDANATVELPVIDIFFILVILLLSRLLIENKQLREDNSLFI